MINFSSASKIIDDLVNAARLNHATFESDSSLGFTLQTLPRTLSSQLYILLRSSNLLAREPVELGWIFFIWEIPN